MGISNFAIIAIVVVISIICNAVVQWVKATSKEENLSKREKHSQAIFENRFEALEDELDDARQRIEVLERIVTEPKAELERKIASL